MMIEVDNIKVNNDTIVMIHKEIKERNKDLYDQIDELNKLNIQNNLNINKYVNDKNNHIVERYILWCNHAEKENDDWRIDSKLILENVCCDHKYEFVSVMESLNDDLFSSFLYYETTVAYSCYSEPDYIDKCIKLFENLIVDKDVYDKEDDKEYLAELMEEVIKVNVESFTNEW